MREAIQELIRDPRPRLPVTEVAAAWGCEPERVAWLADNGHLRSFMVGRPIVNNIRIFPLEAERKRHLAAMDIPAGELARYTPEPPRIRKPKRVREPIEVRIKEAIAGLSPTQYGHVYFARCGDFVKIGFSQMPSQRVHDLAAGTPYDLKVLKIIPGNRQHEARLHDCLDEYHHRREWFRLTPELLAAIRRMPGTKGRRNG